MASVCPCQTRLASACSPGHPMGVNARDFHLSEVRFGEGLSNCPGQTLNRIFFKGISPISAVKQCTLESRIFFLRNGPSIAFGNCFRLPRAIAFHSVSRAQFSDAPLETSPYNSTTLIPNLETQLDSDESLDPIPVSGLNDKSTSFVGNVNSSLNFSELGVSPSVVSRLKQVGVDHPTDIQSLAIPSIFKGHDIALQSYTGSGKTLAFLIPILSLVGPLRKSENNLDASSKTGANLSNNVNVENSSNKDYKGIEAVIVAPSRELAMQIFREAEKILGSENKNAVQQLIGGANQRRQEESIKLKKPRIVIGTPGRVSDLSRAGKLQTHFCRFLVLDEADSLLSHKFRLEMIRILDHVGRRRSGDSPNEAQNPKTFTNRTERQTILVSATMPPAVLEAAANWGNRPLHIKANSGRQTNGSDTNKINSPVDSSSNQKLPPLNTDASSPSIIQGIKDSIPPNLDHRYIVAPHRHRVDVLRKCIHALDAKSVIVFMNFGKRLKDTEFKLAARQISVANLHGGIDKVKRSNVLSSFRDGKVRVLVVSEVAARGLDIVSCDLVINLELPSDASHYAHRAGRTGRLGRKGMVITICEESEAFVIKKFSKQLEIDISRSEVFEGKMLPYSGKMKY